MLDPERTGSFIHGGQGPHGRDGGKRKHEMIKKMVKFFAEQPGADFDGHRIVFMPTRL